MSVKHIASVEHIANGEKCEALHICKTNGADRLAAEHD
jgi:hypothetical protein